MLAADTLASDPHQVGGRRVLFVSGADVAKFDVAARSSGMRGSLRSTWAISRREG